MNKIILGLVAMCFVFNTFAQDNEPTQLVTDTDYETVIELDSAKRNYEPAKAVKVPVENEAEQAYEAKDYSISVNKLQPRIPIYPIKGADPKQLNGGLVKIGFGNYVSPYLEVFVNNTKDKKKSIGARVKHFSSQNGPIDKQNSGQSDTEVELLGGYYGAKKVNLFGDINFDRTGVRFYGYNDSLEDVQISDVRRVFNQFDINTKLESKTKGNLNYKANLGFNTISDNYDVSENTFNVKAEVKYDLDEFSHVYVETDNYFGGVKDSLNSTGRTYIGVHPYYSFYNPEKRLRTNIGARIVAENDSLSKKGFHVYPHIELDYLLVKPVALRAYAGLTGDMERNSVSKLVAENPFINPALRFANTNKTIAFYAGVTSTLKKYFTVKVEGGYENYKNQYFYVNNTLDQSKFDLAIDSNNVTRAYFDVDLKYQKKRLVAGAGVELNSWGVSAVAEAYHRPSFISEVYANYKLNKKLTLGVRTETQGGIKVFDVENNSNKTLPFIADLNLNAVYKHNDKVSFWLDTNNLLFKEYQKYLYYPSKGLNFLVGFTYKINR